MSKKFIYSTTAEAAKHGDIDEIELMIRKKCPKDPYTIVNAIKNQKYDCMVYCFINDFPVNWIASYTAAQFGLITYLEYLFTNGCSWDYRTTAMASYYGHLDCLEYAHSNGCEWNEEVLHNAAKNNHFECFKYALDNKCPSDVNVPYIALVNKSLECFKYYIKTKTKIPALKVEAICDKVKDKKLTDDLFVKFLYKQVHLSDLDRLKILIEDLSEYIQTGKINIPEGPKKSIMYTQPEETKPVKKTVTKGKGKSSPKGKKATKKDKLVVDVEFLEEEIEEIEIEM